MKQDSKRLSSIILALLFAVGAVVVYFEFIVPSYQALEVTKGSEENEQALYTNENQIVSKVNSLLSSYQTNSSSSQSVALALPVGPDISGALAQIYGIATNSGVTVQGTGISVQAVQAPTAAPANGQIASAAADGSIIAPVGSISMQVSGSGTYASFKSFLQGLEGNLRIFNVSNISLQPVVATNLKGQPLNEDMLNFTLTVVTYYQAP